MGGKNFSGCRKCQKYQDSSVILEILGFRRTTSTDSDSRLISGIFAFSRIRDDRYSVVLAKNGSY